MERIDNKRSNGHIWIGVFLLFLGASLFIKQMDFPFPDWIFSWKTLVIAIGILVGFKSEFRNPAWVVLILVGSIFLSEDLLPGLNWHQYAWPLGFIVLGLVAIFRPSRNRNWNRWQDHKNEPAEYYDREKFTNEDVLDHTTFFGSIQKNILTKDFRGGEMVTIFGGSELNFIQADINGTVILDITQIFGGTKLIVPSNWNIKSEMTAVFAGIEDKRPPQAAVATDKVLVIKGTSIFGGIEIVSY